MSSNDCLAQVASADVEWLFVSAYNRGVALAAQPGRGRDAEEFLSAALGLQRAARVLLQREADVKMALQAVQSMAMSSHPATSNPCVDKGDPDVSPQPSTFSSCG